MDLNKAMIIGRLTRDPEIRTTTSGQNVASFSLATNYVWTDQSGAKQEKVEYHNIIAWRKLADVVGRYLRKGGKVYIEGRLQTREWVGQQDNIKRYRTEIIAENMIMLDRAQANAGQFGHDSVPMPTGPEESYMSVDQGPRDADEDEIRVENIPF